MSLKLQGCNPGDVGSIDLRIPSSVLECTYNVICDVTGVFQMSSCCLVTILSIGMT